MKSIVFFLSIIFLLSCESPSDFIPNPYIYRDNNPAWSNNGEKIAFFSTGIKQVSSQTRGLYIINSDGSNKVLIEELSSALSLTDHPVWLLGDSELVYSHEGLYKININTKEKIQLLSDDASFDMSPDGNHFYYTTDVDSAGCDYLILHKNMLSDRIDTIICGFYPSISPDMQFIAFNSDGSISYVDMSDNSVISLNLVGALPDWSPTNSLLVYQLTDDPRYLPDIYITDLSGNNYKIVESGYSPNFSPDGNKIVYVDSLTHLNLYPTHWVGI